MMIYKECPPSVYLIRGDDKGLVSVQLAIQPKKGRMPLHRLRVEKLNGFILKQRRFGALC